MNGKPGFALIQNLYFNPIEKTFLFGGVREDDFKVYVQNIFPERTSGDNANRWLWDPLPSYRAEMLDISSVSDDEISFEAADGLMLVLNEVNREMISHYFHFMEYLEATWAVIHEFDVGHLPVRYIVYPYSDETSWQGKPPNYINKQLLFLLWPEATILDEKTFSTHFKRRLTHRQGVCFTCFSKVVVVDRQSAHHIEITGKLNKMNAGIMEEIKKHHPLLRDVVLQRLNISSSNQAAKNNPFQKVVIVDRERGERSMSRMVLSELVRALNVTRKYDVDVVNFEMLSFIDQLKIAVDADVMIGVHGNGLTHLLWMKPGSTLVEMFPAGLFLTDYQFNSEFAGLKHFGWDTMDGLIYQSLNVLGCADALQIDADHKADKIDQVADVLGLVNLTVELSHSSMDWDTIKSRLQKGKCSKFEAGEHFVEVNQASGLQK
jgi:hypothetical protein